MYDLGLLSKFQACKILWKDLHSFLGLHIWPWSWQKSGFCQLDWRQQAYTSLWSSHLEDMPYMGWVWYVNLQNQPQEAYSRSCSPNIEPRYQSIPAATTISNLEVRDPNLPLACALQEREAILKLMLDRLKRNYLSRGWPWPEIYTLVIWLISWDTKH